MPSRTKRLQRRWRHWREMTPLERHIERRELRRMSGRLAERMRLDRLAAKSRR